MPLTFAAEIDNAYNSCQWAGMKYELFLLYFIHTSMGNNEQVNTFSAVYTPAFHVLYSQYGILMIFEKVQVPPVHRMLDVRTYTLNNDVSL